LKVYQNATVGSYESLEQQERDGRKCGGWAQGSSDDYRVEETRGTINCIR